MFKEWRMNKVRNVITSSGDMKKVNFLASVLRLKPEDYVIEWNMEDLKGLRLDFLYPDYEEVQEELTTDICCLKNFGTSKERRIRLLHGIIHYHAYEDYCDDEQNHHLIGHFLRVLNLESDDLDHGWIAEELKAGEKYLDAVDEAIGFAGDAEYQGWRAERQFEGLPDSIADYKDWIDEQEKLDKLVALDSNWCTSLNK